MKILLSAFVLMFWVGVTALTIVCCGDDEPVPPQAQSDVVEATDTSTEVTGDAVTVEDAVATEEDVPETPEQDN